MPSHAKPLLLSILAGVLLSVPSVHGQVINEFVGNHTGPDLYEFVEVLGAAVTDYSHLTVVQIEGDVGSDSGRVQSTYTVGTTDADGLWFSGFHSDDFDHDDSYTLLLVDGWSGSVGVDLDVGDDGTLDSTPWTSVLDSIAVTDGDVGDHSYGAETVLAEFFDGEVFSPGGASRIPNGADTNSVDDWTRNDWDGTGLPTLPGNLEPFEAVNTPGEVNATTLGDGADPLLHEVVADHVGLDDHEYVEIWGDGQTDYSRATILLLDGGGQVDGALAVGSTDGSGFWTTGFLTDTLADDTLTLLLVADWSGSVGDDLDGDDNGSLDVTPWTDLYDSVAISHGVGTTYSTAVLADGHGGSSGVPGGASRLPNYSDTDSADDWLRNDFDGEGLPGFTGTLEAGEALNTPGSLNLGDVSTYYQGVDATSSATLRTTLHEAIDDHQLYPYTDSTTDTWDILELADEDPADAGRILTLYKNSSEAKQGGGNSFYNREHTWPKTYGFPDEGNSYPYTDCHHLRLANIGYNSDRGSRAFGTCSGSCSERQTDVNNGQGGGSGTYPGNSNWFTGSDGGTGTWEAWNHRKGDVARTVLYMDLRYEGGNHGVTGLAEPDLVLTDDTSLIVGSGSNTSGTAYMGRLATVLAWHAADPVDDDERLRNEVVYQFQGNRNPFVDHPEWVECLHLDTGCDAAEPPMFGDGFESGDVTGWSSAVGN